jgi:hypothetical protein
MRARAEWMDAPESRLEAALLFLFFSVSRTR